MKKHVSLFEWSTNVIDIDELQFKFMKERYSYKYLNNINHHFFYFGFIS